MDQPKPVPMNQENPISLQHPGIINPQVESIPQAKFKSFKISMIAVISSYNLCQMICFIISCYLTGEVAHYEGEVRGLVIIDILVFIVIPMSLLGYFSFLRMSSLWMFIVFGILKVIMLLYTLAFALLIGYAVRMRRFHSPLDNDYQEELDRDHYRGPMIAFAVFCFISAGCQLAVAICTCVACCKISPAQKVEIIRIVQVQQMSPGTSTNAKYAQVNQNLNCTPSIIGNTAKLSSFDPAPQYDNANRNILNQCQNIPASGNIYNEKNN